MAMSVGLVFQLSVIISLIILVLAVGSPPGVPAT
ncbi:MAG: hypothetical protein PWP05_554 [Thermovirga sp.]|jgi:hypothetical protein|nr:hypothetical protein [Thermovirga sp.]MDN5367839.1 hypothetical protein [Thermovirga sp.]